MRFADGKDDRETAMGTTFDQVTRSLAMTPSRRGVAGLLAAAAFAATGWDASAKRKSKNKNKKKKRCKPACGECQACIKQTCQPVVNGTPCKSADVCEDGQCVAEGCGDGPACPSSEVCIDDECVALRCGNGGPCRIFVADAGVPGAEMGGLVGADIICQTAALDAGLSGTFMAWLSSPARTPADRFIDPQKAGPYQLVRSDDDGDNPPPTVSPDFATLVNCPPSSFQCLQHPINRMLNGTVLVGIFLIWTGTMEDGTAAEDTCAGWTDAGQGLVGLATATGREWTNSQETRDCQDARFLYCFEQAGDPESA
jgi:hypothetical protein